MDATEPKTPIVLDCDTGIDDALAIAYLLAAPRAELLAITTVFGNVTAAQGARNTLDMLALAGRPEVPVYLGATASLDGAFIGGAPRVHGANGIGDAELPRAEREPEKSFAPDYLVRAAHQHAGELVIVAIGPLTNLALALTLDPSIVGKVRRLVIMGGAVLAPGNATPAAEANVWHDPEAADRVLASGLPITLVPLDATMRQTFSLSDREALARGGAVSRFLAAALDRYFTFYRGVFGDAGLVALHDPLAVAIALDDTVVLDEALTTVRVDIGSSAARGSTVADLRTFRRGHVVLPEATTRVVLETENDLAARLVAAAARLP